METVCPMFGVQGIIRENLWLENTLLTKFFMLENKRIRLIKIKTILYYGDCVGFR